MTIKDRIKTVGNIVDIQAGIWLSELCLKRDLFMMKRYIMKGEFKKCADRWDNYDYIQELQNNLINEKRYLVKTLK